jgi:hypothetical protein
MKENDEFNGKVRIFSDLTWQQIGVIDELEE